MKLTYQQFEVQLNKDLHPLYIISGDEYFLCQEAIQTIKKQAKHSGFFSCLRFNLEIKENWENLFNELYSPSLLGEKRIIEIDLRTTTLHSSFNSLITDYVKQFIKNLPATINTDPENKNSLHNPKVFALETLLIIQIGKLDAKTAKQSWYIASDSIGVTLALWPISRAQLPNWLLQRAKKYKLNLSLAAATHLADYTEGHLAAAAQMIEKLYLLKTDDLSIENLAQIFSNESHYSTFDFVDSFIAANAAAALEKLQQLRAGGAEVILVLWALMRELRILTQMAQEIEYEGALSHDLMQKYHVFPKRQSLVKTFLAQHSVSMCSHLLKKTADIDAMIKGMLAMNAWEALEIFCFRS